MSSAENEVMADRRLSRTIAVTVNGRVYERRVSTRKNLADFLREDLGLTGTHVGCEHGVCGACSLFVDGVLLRSCLMLAVQCDGAEIRTIEGLGQHELHAVQQAFWDHHALQCGFCTPGMILTVIDLVTRARRVVGSGRARQLERQHLSLYRLSIYCRCHPRSGAAV